MYTVKKDKNYLGKRVLGCLILIALMTISLAAFAAAETEPNDSISTADTLSSSGDVEYGYLNEYSDDEDFYRIHLNSGSTIYINLVGTGDDFDLRLYNTYETSVDSSSGSSSYESISYTATRSGYHYIRCYAFDGSGDYTLTVTVDGGIIGPTGISPWIWAAVVIIIIVVVVIVALAVVLSKKPPRVQPQPPPNQQQQWQQPQYQQPPPQQPPPQQPPPQQPPQQPPPGNP